MRQELLHYLMLAEGENHPHIEVQNQDSRLMHQIQTLFMLAQLFNQTRVTPL